MGSRVREADRQGVNGRGGGGRENETAVVGVYLAEEGFGIFGREFHSALEEGFVKGLQGWRDGGGVGRMRAKSAEDSGSEQKQ